MSSLLPDLFTARNVAEDTCSLCDRHAAFEGDMSLSQQCEPFLSPPFSFHVSIRACLLLDIATTCRVRYVERSVNAALDLSLKSLMSGVSKQTEKQGGYPKKDIHQVMRQTETNYILKRQAIHNRPISLVHLKYQFDS